MSFLYPYFLYILLPILFVMFGFLFRKKDSSQHYFSKEVMEKLKVGGSSLSLRTRNILFFISSVLIVIALAQPVIKDGSIEIKAKSSDIMIALDISDSMLAQDVYPNRLELAKQKALKFLKEIADERVGVVAFAKNSYLVSPLSFDTSAVAFLLSKLDTTSITQKGTNLLSMLEVVASSKTSTDKKYLFILSDGGDKNDFAKEIEFAKDNDIVIFVLGMGTIKGAPIKLKNGEFIKQNSVILISKLNENISELATSTGGVYIQNTTSQNDIMAMLSEISSVSEKKELKAQEIQKYTPLFYYPLSLALLLILIATSSLGKINSNKLSHAMILFLVLLINTDAKAGVLDFLDLNEAKEAYEAGDYEKSAKIYKEYADKNSDAQSNYNTANAYYKQKKYDKALEYYKKANFKEDNQKANNLANMGNSYVKSATKDSLKNAKESYEKSLDIREDKEIRENLDAVLKELEKQKKQDKQENKDEDKKDKEIKIKIKIKTKTKIKIKKTINLKRKNHKIKILKVKRMKIKKTKIKKILSQKKKNKKKKIKAKLSHKWAMKKNKSGLIN
ncbi:MAG: VWA domain-containing protein [Sulfurimonas sp.]|nr:VWA domain-containing protein [Sulfurimonas sp.]